MLAETHKVSLNVAWVAVGVVVATVIGSNMLTIQNLSSDPNTWNASVFDKTIEYISVFGITMVFGLFVSVAMALIIGWPMYVTGKKLGMVNSVTLVIGGALIPCIAMMICEATGWNIPPISDIRGALMLACLAFCGAVGGGISCFGLHTGNDLELR